MVSDQFSFAILFEILSWGAGHIILGHPEPRTLYEWNVPTSCRWRSLVGYVEKETTESAGILLLMTCTAGGEEREEEESQLSLLCCPQWNIHWTLSVSPGMLVTSWDNHNLINHG